MTPVFTRLGLAPFLPLCRLCALSILSLMLTPGAIAAVAGDPAPELRLRSLDPETPAPDMPQLRGKVVYVDFWASWCGPCRLSLPAMQRIYDDLGGEDFEVLAISVDAEASDAQAFLERYPVSYPVLFDPDGESPQRYGVLGMPTAFLVDRKGDIRLVHAGFRRSDEQRVRAAIEELLQE